MAAFASRVGQPRARRSACSRRRWHNANAAFDLAQRRVPADARLRARDPARRQARRRRPSTPRSRGSRRRRKLRRPERARRPGQAAPPGHGRPRQARRRDAEQLLPQTDLASKCVTRRRPADRRRRIARRRFTTGAENYKEFWYALVGLAGEGQNFDGNGQYVRFQTGGGAQTVSLGSKSSTHRRAVRQRTRGAAGQPAGLPGQAPAVQPDVPLLQAAAARRQRPGRGDLAAHRHDDRAAGVQPAGPAAPPGRPRGRAREAQPVRPQGRRGGRQ